MANLSITLTSVRQTQDTKSRVVVVEAGGVIVGGEFLYKDSTNLYRRAKWDGTTEESEAVAFALTGAAATGQYVTVIEGKCIFSPRGFRSHI